MSGVSVSFTVTSVTRARRKEAPNQYTATVTTPPMWRVTMRCDWTPDRYMELWFEEEAQARKVRKGPLSIAELFGLLEPFDVKFTVNSIRRDKAPLGKNWYTDRIDWQDAWVASMSSQTGPGRYVDLWYPNQAEADQWALGKAYGPIDFLRVFRILVFYYPAGIYVTELAKEGFFDAQGYHKPGIYPRGFYPAGVVVAGSVIDLETPDFLVQGHYGYLIFS